MADWTPSRLGQSQATGSPVALFLKIFTGEVLKAFRTNLVAANFIRRKTIPYGESGSFNVMGNYQESDLERINLTDATALGKEFTGKAKIKAAEILVPIDGPTIADVAIGKFDELLNHYDVRGEYSSQLGYILAKKIDKKILQTLALGAAATKNINDSDQYGGVVYNTVAGVDTTASKLRDAISSIAQSFDEHDVMDTDRHTILKPAQWWLLVNEGQCFHRDYNNEVNGSQAQPSLYQWANVFIHKSNNIPSTVITQDTADRNTYHGDFTKNVAPVFQREALGMVSLLDLAVEQEYSVSRQSTLLLAKLANGIKALRPECIGQIATP